MLSLIIHRDLVNRFDADATTRREHVVEALSLAFVDAFAAITLFAVLAMIGGIISGQALAETLGFLGASAYLLATVCGWSTFWLRRAVLARQSH